MKHVPSVLLVVAAFCGCYALVAWMDGLLFDAGIAAALCGLAITTAGMFWAPDQDQVEEARAYREWVWERRERECFDCSSFEDELEEL